MLRRSETLFDERTGTPIALPLLPNGLEGDHSWHHAAHPKDHELLQGTGGLAIRCARMQLVQGPGGRAARLNEAGEIPPDTKIHPLYHLNYEGPPLPETQSERFGYIIMMLADYIPETGIDLSQKHPTERRIKSEELTRLRSGEIRVGSYSAIQDFFTEYLIENGKDHYYDPRDVDDFLTAPDGSHRFHMGDRLIETAVINAVQPWIRPYKDARRNGLLGPNAPKSVYDIVQSAFGRETTRQGRIQKMYTHMAAPALQTGVSRVQLASQ